MDKVYSAKGMANYLAKYLMKGRSLNPGKRGYWYSFEWIHRKWHAFSKAMYKYGERVSSAEFELIHEIKELSKRVEYMNRRMIEAGLNAIRIGIIRGQVDLIQFLAVPI